MEINLIYIFSAVIIFGLINFVFIFTLKGKVQDVETRLHQENKTELAALKQLISDNQSTLALSIESLNVNTVEMLDATTKRLNEQFSSLESLLTSEVKNNNTANKELAQLIISTLSDHNAVISAKSEAKVLTQLIDAQEHQKTMAFSSKQEQLANLAQLSSLVQTLRIENIVEITNELSKHNELKVETPDFIKHLGDCKVLKIEDAHSGQVTQVFYENGIKRSTDTFAGENLKYQMFYDETGKAQRGIELDTDGKTTFEYTYDDAGEICKRIEFNYDEAGQESNQIEKSY
jgi:hypothetical protein